MNTKTSTAVFVILAIFFGVSTWHSHENARESKQEYHRSLAESDADGIPSRHSNAVTKRVRQDPEARLRDVDAAWSALEQRGGDPSDAAYFALLRKLEEWAFSDPLAAFAWCHAHQLDGNHERMGSLLYQAMRTDPHAAFEIFQKLTPEMQDKCGYRLFLGDDPKARLEILNLLRDSIGKIEDRKRSREQLTQVMRDLSSSLVDQKDGNAWINEADLSNEEKKAFAEGIGSNAANEKTGEWLRWVSDNLSVDQAKDPIRKIIHKWTNTDHQAVATWLNESPASPTKDIVMSNYASSIAVYDSHEAIPWANALPEGEVKQATYAAIFYRWRKDDPEGKAAFGEKHGLK